MGYASWNKPADFNPPNPPPPSGSSTSTPSVTPALWSPALTAAGWMLIVFSGLFAPLDNFFVLGGALLAAGSARASSEKHGTAHFMSYVGLIIFGIIATLRLVSMVTQKT